MIAVKEGQTVVYQSHGGYYTARADKVTPKQVRTLVRGQWQQTHRDLVLFAGDAESASALRDRLDELRFARIRETQKANAAFKIAVAPAEEIRDSAIVEAKRLEQIGVLALVDQVNAAQAKGE
jgi:hypothetical protein